MIFQEEDLDLHSASEGEEALDFTGEHKPRETGSGSEDEDAPVELKTWTGLTRQTSPKALNSPGSSRTKPMIIPDDSATGASTYSCIQTRQLNLILL